MPYSLKTHCFCDSKSHTSFNLHTASINQSKYPQVGLIKINWCFLNTLNKGTIKKHFVWFEERFKREFLYKHIVKNSSINQN